MTVACGGHPLPLVIRADGAVEEFGTPGTLLGLIEHPDLQDRLAELRSGDTLLLYTDGLTEAGAPEHMWEPEELAAAARASAGGSAEATVSHLLTSATGAVPVPRDDIALLALRAN